MVAMRIAAGRFEQRSRYGEVAVLYRGNHQARAFERALSAQNVPYVISGGQSWFERTEIKDLVSYLRLIANDDDDPAFVRAVTTPRRGIGAQTLDKLGQAASARGQSLFAAVYDEGLRGELPARQREALDAFCALIAGLRYRAEREPAGRLLEELLSTIGYDDYLYSTLDKPQAQTKSESVREFTSWFGKKGETDERNLLELTQRIALLTMLDGKEGKEPDAVHLSTLHAAKGLEFMHVFLVGVEEGILPHREAVAAGNVEEERRLMYVGITRARASLQISWCRRRKRQGEWRSCEASRFIAELAQEDVRHAFAPALEPEDAARGRREGAAHAHARVAFALTPHLLGGRGHEIHARLELRVGQLRSRTRRHRTLAVQNAVVKRGHAGLKARRPGSLVAELRRARNAGGMTHHANGLVDFLSIQFARAARGHGWCHGDGRRHCRGYRNRGRRRGGRSVRARKHDLPDRLDA